VGSALVCLLGAIGVGLSLAWTPADDDRLRWVPIYAALGLVGFLGQAIVGVSARLLPVFVWLRAYGGRNLIDAPPPPQALVLRELQPWCWASWTSALVALIVGLLRAGRRLGARGRLPAAAFDRARYARPRLARAAHAPRSAGAINARRRSRNKEKRPARVAPGRPSKTACAASSRCAANGR
jgi:hypothetical protein